MQRSSLPGFAWFTQAITKYRVDVNVQCIADLESGPCVDGNKTTIITFTAGYKITVYGSVLETCFHIELVRSINNHN